MNIVYGRALSENENFTVLDIANSCGILFDTAKLLFYRGIDTVQKAKKFLSPEKYDYYNPFLLDGVEDAVKRIKEARNSNEKVLIFGDYDVDGICAVSTLHYCFNQLGLNTYVEIPEREDGYGLNVEKVKSIKEQFGVSLLITVDCGISDAEKIEEIKKLGIDVIVTDHHEPPENLPDCIKINPKIKGQKYEFDGLCGAGVAFKLSQALIGGNAENCIDLTALATVADSMELVDENRKIVTHGLKLMNKSLRLPLKYLLGDTNKAITTQTLSYNFAPRINAGGRMGDAKTALNLFIEKDEKKVFDYAVKLNEYNIERQAGCDEIYREAKSIIKENKLYLDQAILVSGENWKTGFIGIVAARLVEDYNRPVIVFSGINGLFKGSARSVDGINIHEAILSAKEHLTAFGGHSQAAGVSIEKDKFNFLKERVCEYIEKNCELKKEKEYRVDWEVLNGISIAFAKEIVRLEPFGLGNKKPCFSIRIKDVDCKPLKSGSSHFVFNFNGMDFLNFNGEEDLLKLSAPITKTLIFESDYSVFKGKEYLKGIVKHIAIEGKDLSGVSLYAFRNELLKLKFDCELNVKTLNEINVQNGIGTVYAISDTDNKFDIKGLPVYLFKTPEKNVDNCVVISPSYISDGFLSCVYLDVPLSYFKNGLENFSIKGNYLKIRELSCDRAEFEKIYKYLLNVKDFSGSLEYYLENKPDFNVYEFIFVTEVFLELEFFTIVNGKLVKNLSNKKQLNSSKIFDKIFNLKGNKL